SDLCMIYKNNGREGPKAWRPIALMSCLGKFIELVIKNRLVRSLGCPPPSAHGYCAHRSTVTAVEHITGLSYNPDNERMVTTTFDVSAAFDKISFDHIIKEVVALTDTPAWGKLISSYLHGNKVVLDNDHTFRVAGVAQGGVLAPICFALSTWRMGTEVSTLTGPFNIRIALYADDICVRITAAGILGLIQGLQKTVDIIMAWVVKADLQLDPQKNEAITDSQSTTDLLVDELASTDLEYIGNNIKPEIKWLGIWLNPKGSWRLHIEHAFGKGKRAMYILRRIIGRDRDIDPKLALLGWKAHVVPTILYGCELWGEVARYKWFIDKCTKLEASFSRLIFGLVKTTPTVFAARLLASLADPIWVQTRVRYASSKLHKRKLVPINLPPRVEHYLEDWGVTSIKDREVHNLDNSLITDPENLGRAKIIIGDGSPPKIDSGNTLCFYSDGSVIDRGNTSAKTGAGVVRLAPESPLGYEGRSYNTGNSSNIAQCELVGVERSIAWANEIAPSQANLENLYVCLDSQAALRSIQKALTGKTCTELITSIIEEVHRWTNTGNKRVYLWWVKGHQGHIYNELSDIYAGRAARQAAGTIQRQ
ncbi:hypothetical protein FOL47_002709, partial [Perkinsus chesapeaki]